jgi:predicted nucleic acid-binding Zn ribbon protein
MDTHNQPRPSEPQALGKVLSRLFALRGYGRVNGDKHLHNVWHEAAGESIASRTKVLGLRNGMLLVAVGNSALLSELAAFHRHSLLESLRSRNPQMHIRDIRFRLRGELGERDT